MSLSKCIGAVVVEKVWARTLERPRRGYHAGAWEPSVYFCSNGVGDGPDRLRPRHSKMLSPHPIVPMLQRGNAAGTLCVPVSALCRRPARTLERPLRGYHAGAWEPSVYFCGNGVGDGPPRLRPRHSKMLSPHPIVPMLRVGMLQGRSAFRFQRCAGGQPGRWSVHCAVTTLERGNHRFISAAMVLVMARPVCGLGIARCRAPTRSFPCSAWECMQGRSAFRFQRCAGGRPGRWSVHCAVTTLERGNHQKRSAGSLSARKTEPPPDRSHAPAWECMPGCSASRFGCCRR